MTFDKAVEKLLKSEGGYVNHPNDPGGETNFGISKRAYPGLDIKNITQSDAIGIYRRDYWDRIRANELPAKLRYLVFDAAVNQGPGFAVGTLQALLGLQVTGTADRALGLAAYEAGDIAVLRRFSFRRRDAYLKNKRFATFGAGWLNRLLEVTLDSLA